MLAAEDEVENEELLEGADIFYVCKKALESAKEKANYVETLEAIWNDKVCVNLDNWYNMQNNIRAYILYICT